MNNETRKIKTFTEKVIDDFFRRKMNLRKFGISSVGLKLYSYNTCIAQHIGKERIAVNTTKYSRTTTRQVNKLLKMAAENRFEVEKYDNLKINIVSIIKEY